MGFEKDDVQRAFGLYGKQEKNVLDFLVAFKEIKPLGYDLDLIESALVLFDFQIDKSKSYLGSFKAFQEMGFSPEEIKKALVEKNLDREAALESLVG